MKLITSNAITMSSREIATLTNASHDNVLKTIRALMEKGVVSGNETPYKHPQNGQKYTEFMLSYRDTMVVVSGYSVELRAKIIDRWQELEAKDSPSKSPSLPDFSNPAIAARAWAEQYEVAEQAKNSLAIAAPKVEFVDQYVEASGSMTFRQVCKLLGANERDFRIFLRAEGIMYCLSGEWTAYANHIGAGRFEVKTGTAAHNDHAYTSARFTPKGVEWVSALWRKEVK